MVLRFLKRFKSNALEYTATYMPGNFYWKNRQGKYVGCNQGALNALQLSAENFIGKTDNELWPDQTELFKKNDVLVIENQLSTVVEQTISTEANGSKIFIITRVPWLDKKGYLIGIIGSLTDITAQKQRELALQDENDMLRSSFEKIIDAVPGILYWKDKKGVYKGCNNFMIKATNLHSKDDLIGKTDKMLWSGHESLLSQNDSQVMQTGQAISIEEKVNGRTYLSTKKPLFNEKNVIIGVIGNSVDITYLKEVESGLLKTKETAKMAEIASNAKTKFLENMRHDIRSPIASIVGISELLSYELDKNKAKQYTDGLAETSKELLRFLNEILESINLTSGDIPLVRKPFNLKEVLKNVIKLHKIIALERQLSLELNFDDNIPKNLIGDPVRIYRIILELLTNALKFTNEGHVKLSVRIGRIEIQNIVIQIFVEDTGLGISEEQQQELAIRFKRSTSFHEDTKKTGLGLSIVKQFIDDLGGEIYVDSCLTVGTKFVCVIPLIRPLLEEPFNNPSLVSLEVFSQKNKMNRVPKRCGLIVEDQSIAGLIAKTLFSKQGCEVDIAENGKVAMTQVQKYQYSFILMDIGLPGMNGYEVTKQIRLFEKTSGHRRTFIVGLTCYADDKKKQLALDAGMNIVLTKPLTQEIVVDLLENFIFHHSENQKIIENVAADTVHKINF